VIEGVALHRQANDLLGGLDVSSLSDDGLEAAIVELRRENERSLAVEARLVGAFDARKAYRSDGSRSTAARLSRKTKVSRREVRGQVRLGRRLKLMPKVDAALTAGEITVEHAQILGKLAASVSERVAGAFPESEGQLLGFAKDLSFVDFVTAVRYWEQRADAVGAEEKAKKQHGSRRVHLSETLEGEWYLEGRFDPVAGTKLATALRRIEKELFEQDWAEAKEIHGDDTRVEDLARTPAQRRADALVVMAERAMAMPQGARLPAPLVTVHLGYETAKGPLCELSNGTVVTPGQIIPLLTEAEIERAVFAGPKRIIELGQRTRFFTGGLRRCVEIIHRRCVHPGCDVPAEECQIDHVKEYEDGGLTLQDNGEPRCDSHNLFKTNTKTRTTPRPQRRRRPEPRNQRPKAKKPKPKKRPPTGGS
jgi:hypothetical protein